MTREDGKGFSVSIEEIRENDMCLHPAHYMTPPRYPYHHKDRIRLDEIQAKIDAKQAEADKLKAEQAEL